MWSPEEAARHARDARRLAIAVAGLLAWWAAGRLAVGPSFGPGGAVFAGGIQGYVLTGSKVLQYATPIGGITMMAGWASLSAAHLRQLMERP